ncbi:MAG: branched-chain amino acid ABC transporter permease [Betaproteobacteria bacterium]|nr:MAG: branched-chain amino acid ABC transporter permease [Betaproteobacteria bacterium]
MRVTRDIGKLVPLATATALLAGLPFVGVGEFTITLLTEALIFGIWAMSLDLLVGYAGLVSFGHAAAFGLAAYSAGYFAREVMEDFFAALLVAEAVNVLVALVVGFVIARVSGIAFAILTLCIAQVLFTIAVIWRSLTNGMDGMVGVPLPKIFGISLASGTAFYLLTVFCLVGVYLALTRLVDSPFGRTLQALRASEERAASIGINVHLHKWLAFVLSWAVAALAGTLMVFLKAGTTPMSLHWTESGNVLVMAILGGIGTLLGPVIGATVFVFVRDEFTSRFQAWQFVFGLVFVVVVLAFPTGLVGLLNRIHGLRRRTRSAGEFPAVIKRIRSSLWRARL